MLKRLILVQASPGLDVHKKTLINNNLSIEIIYLIEEVNHDFLHLLLFFIVLLILASYLLF